MNYNIILFFLFAASPPLVSTKYRQQLMQYWNSYLPDIIKNKTYIPTGKLPNLPPFHMETSRNTGNRDIPWPFGKINRHSSGFRTTEEPIFANVIKTRPSDDREKEDMLGTRNVESSFMITPPPSNKDHQQIGTTMNIVITVGAVFLIINVIVFAVLFYKKTKLKMEERNLKRQYEDMQNANLDLEGAGTLREKVPLPPPGGSPEGCNVMKMIRQSTKSEDTYEAVKASEGSSNQRFKLTRNISSSTLDPHTKVRDWIAQEIVQKCSPRFLRRTRQQFAMEHKQKEAHKSDKTDKDIKTIKTSSSKGQPPTRPATPGCKNSSVASSQKPMKVSVAIDATHDARSSSVLKQEPIEISKSLDKSSPPAPGRMRRSQTLEDFTLDEKPRPPLKRQNSITEIPVSKDVGETQIIKIHHQHSRSDPVDVPPPEQNSTPKLKTFDANQDVNVTCKDETKNNPVLTPEEALQTIKRRNFPKVLPDFPIDPNYSSMKRRSLPSHSLLSFTSFPENKSATMDNRDNHNKLYSRIPPAPPPRTSSTLGRKPPNTSPAVVQMSPVKVPEEPPKPEPVITSNTLHVGPLIPSRSPMRKMESVPSTSQPIYDNLRNYKNDEPTVKPKNVAKTIISADQEHPVKRVEPKVIIKPNTSSLRRDPSKVNKVIPRVIAKDNSVDEIPESLSRQSSVPPSPTTPTSPTPLVLGPTNIPVPPPMPSSPLSPSPSATSDQSVESSSSDSSNSTSSDTGTVVKRH